MVVMTEAHLQGQQVDTMTSMEGIQLQPFLHQVSGRAIMMCLNENTVCKPLNSREYCFYQSLPNDILQYTPQYKGVVNVNIEETKDGTIALTAFPPDGEEDIKAESSCTNEENDAIINNDNTEPWKRVLMQAQPTEERSLQKRIHVKRTGSLCIEHTDDEDAEDVRSLKNYGFNPWTMKVYKDGLKRHLHSKNKVVQKCILLENVASRFKFPCILDLKMGTRVHGDFDEPEKRKRHLEKCAKSTTHSLGVRLAGMQVYQHGSGTFLCRNKYFGRALSVDGFRKTLREFFYNGCRMRADVINPIIENLKSLIKRLSMLPSYRFYSSSLLIMYDGAIETVQKPACSKDTNGLSWESNEGNLVQRVDGKTCSNSKNHVSILEASNGDTCNTPVDIRMIDFAKSTHQFMDESVVHKGPDKGYIFGLESLVQLLSTIATEEQQ